MPVSTSAMIKSPYGRGMILSPGVVYQRIEQGERLNAIEDEKERMRVSKLYNLSSSDRFARQQVAKYFGKESGRDINVTIRVPWKDLELISQQYVPEWKREMLIDIIFHYIEHSDNETLPCPNCFISTEYMNYAVSPVNDDYVRIMHAHLLQETGRATEYNPLVELDIPRITPAFGSTSALRKAAIAEKAAVEEPEKQETEQEVTQEEEAGVVGDQEEGISVSINPDALHSTQIIAPTQSVNGFTPMFELSAFIKQAIQQAVESSAHAVEHRLADIIARTIHNTYNDDVKCIAQQKEYILDLQQELNLRNARIGELEATLAEVGTKATAIHEFYTTLFNDSVDINQAIMKATGKNPPAPQEPEEVPEPTE